MINVIKMFSNPCLANEGGKRTNYMDWKGCVVTSEVGS